MTDIARLVADHMDIWTAATEAKGNSGRGAGKRVGFYGVERLRALILDLAVRGRLVRQVAGDEPAGKLLEALRRQQSKLFVAGSIGKPRNLPPPSSRPPFDIPATWEWVQLSDVGHDWGQMEPSDDFTYIDVGSIDQTVGIIKSPAVITAKDAPSRARKLVRHGTVIYSTVRPYLLNIAVVDRVFEPAPIASTAFAIIHPFHGVEAAFLYRYLRSPDFVRYVEGCQTGSTYPAINDRQFYSAWCPLPPAAEQMRIVERVDELMTLCDSLEMRMEQAAETQRLLADVICARALG